MKTYNALLRLYCLPGANIRNEVPKIGLTVPEIMLLRQDPKDLGHGLDCLSKITSGADAVMPDPDAEDGSKPRSVPRSEEYERTRLIMLYGEKRVLDLFGAEYTPLPTKLQNFIQQQVDKPVEDDIAALTA